MRPGHDGPGNAEGSIGLTLSYQASMRPGHDGPGNMLASRIPAIRSSSFNEAGARWPRKRGGLDTADVPAMKLQ